MARSWGVGTYERLAARLRARPGPAASSCSRRRPGDRVLDLATRHRRRRDPRRAARCDGDGDRHRRADAREGARAAPRRPASTITFDLGDVEYLPYDDASFDVVASNFGLVFAPDHANVAVGARPRRAAGRAARLHAPGSPNPKLGELYRRFTEEPIEGREAYEWGREDHVEDMLGDDFELEFEDGTLWLEAESGEEIWKLFSESAPPVSRSLEAARRAGARSSTGRSSSCTRATAADEGGIRAPRRYLLVLGTPQVSRTEVAELLQRLIRLDTTNPPGNETLAAELLRDYLEAAGVECDALRARAGAREPRRAHPRPRRRPVARAPLAYRRRARRRGRMGARPLRRRARRRRGLGPRCARHEGRGRGVRRRARDARARRLARRRAISIFIAAADEEVGAGFGLQWLVEAHPDAVRADFSVNEGAGDRVELGGKVLYLCSTAEKMSSPFLLRCTAAAGTRRCRRSPTTRSSRPRRSSRGSARFAVEPQLIPEVEGFLQALLGEVPAAGRRAGGGRAPSRRSPAS